MRGSISRHCGSDIHVLGNKRAPPITSKRFIDLCHSTDIRPKICLSRKCLRAGMPVIYQEDLKATYFAYVSDDDENCSMVTMSMT